MQYSRFLSRLDDAINNAEYVLGDFAKKLASDPAHAFSWGTSAVAAAAKRGVARYLKASLEGGDNGPRLTLIQVKEWVRDEVLNKAKYPPQSTSPMSNLVEQYTLAAYAGWADYLRYDADIAWTPEEPKDDQLAGASAHERAKAEAPLSSEEARRNEATRQALRAANKKGGV